jgi:hypothetical protein
MSGEARLYLGAAALAGCATSGLGQCERIYEIGTLLRSRRGGSGADKLREVVVSSDDSSFHRADAEKDPSEGIDTTVPHSAGI